MKKKYMHQIIIDSSGFYVFERGLGFYHSFDQAKRIQLIPKLKDSAFYAFCIWVVLIAFGMYFVWSFPLWFCVILGFFALWAAYSLNRNKYILKVSDVRGTHAYEINRKTDTLEVKINEINKRISKNQLIIDS